MPKTMAARAATPASPARDQVPPRLGQLLEVARDLIDEANRTYESVKLPCGSRALAFAVAAGLRPQMSYTVEQTARYSGIDKKTLYEERNAGRLRFVLPAGNSKGNRIMVDEMDRWMRENES